MDFKSEMRKDNTFLIVFSMKMTRFCNGLKEITYYFEDDVLLQN
ncbi:MAG: hypothetical protein RLZZ628_195 [Bacteroidota bacterium]|jgi:hypothetical protein